MVFIIITIVFLFHFSYRHWIQQHREQYDSLTKSIDFIIVRYNEDLKWTLRSPFNRYRYIVYNKGDNQDFEQTCVKKIITLPNVGKCDHGYLYHLYHSYDELADINVFLPGSLDMDYKQHRVEKLIELIMKYDEAVFLSCKTSTTIKDKFYDFTLDDWKTSYGKNAEKNSSSVITKSSIRPLGKWYEKRFEQEQPAPSQYTAFMGIFSISKKDVHQHDRKRYFELMEEIGHDVNPEVGHYIERCWAVIFYPLTNTVIVSDHNC
jgi:hypothetical protein